VVSLREIVASPGFQAGGPLTLALGKDKTGAPATADLEAMPHLLVAGASGTGKSVFLNAALLSILCKADPDTVKLLLIDPKRVDLKLYADMPHLVHPIVVDRTLAHNALVWAVEEMESRYEKLERLGVSKISDYNHRLRELRDNPPPDLADLRPMPYLVLLVDEFADLMLTSGREVENNVVRLAQLARAAGIHLIIATQRPDANVFTGLIKANFLSRVSFKVDSANNSRIILDVGGAERLLGKGDLLHKPGEGGPLQRLHGAFAHRGEVIALTDYWRKRQKPDYQADFTREEEPDADAPAGSGDDPLYQEVAEFVLSRETISIGLIQRRFSMGFNKAARFMEQLEKEGLVSPAQGSKPRSVMR
jgi:S-DNA-T family DNA segregation ATPase FtsK/SpoIIIE